MVPQDKEKFVQLLIPLAHDDQAKAQMDLSDEYYLGANIEKSPEQAKYWLARAAKLGEAGAFSKLSFIYKSGIGVSQDLDKAWVMIREHAKANSPNDTSQQLKNIRKQCAFWHDPNLRYTSINVQWNG